MSTEVVEEVQALDQESEQESQRSTEDTSVQERPPESNPDDDDDDVVVLVDDKPLNQPDEEESTQAPEWVRDLRKQHREAQRKIREQEAELQRLKTPAPKPQPTLAAKPKLEDFDFDTDRYESAVIEWHEQKRQVDALNEQAKRTEEAQKRNWAQRLEVYKSSRDTLKISDYDQAEDAVQKNLNVVQQGIIIQGAENPALVVYAIGKDPSKAKEFAQITDPVKFAIAIGKLETKLKVTNRKPPPPPSTVRGNASVSGTVDSHLERLRVEAERTGDYTKVHQYRQQKKKTS
jgi:hypothetical protein